MKSKHFFIIGFIFFCIAAICSDGYFHPDEHFQLLEFANYKMGGIPGDMLPWEFDEQMRPTLQVIIVYGLSVTLKAVNLFDPYVVSMFLRFLTAGLMFLVLYKFFQRNKVELGSAKSVVWFAAMTFALWYIPFISVRYSSESFGTICALGALLTYQGNDKGRPLLRFLIIGFLLGLSFTFRYQMAFMIFGMGLWMLFIKKDKIVNILVLLTGFVLSLGVATISDYWFYEEWVFSPYNYFYQNLVEDKASGFGVSPFWYYAIETPLSVFPLFGIIIVPCLIVFFIKKPKHIFTWMLIPFILVHHAIGHKELRFLFPIATFLPFIIIATLENLKWLRTIRFMKYPFWVINICLLLVMSIKPAFDNMIVFKYLYRNHSEDQVYFLKKEPPFMIYQYELTNRPFTKGKDLHLSFFHRPDFNPVAFKNIDSLCNEVINQNRTVIATLRTFPYKESYRSQIEKYPIDQKVLFQTYHTWLAPINYQNWLAREDVGAWLVVELSPQVSQMEPTGS